LPIFSDYLLLSPADQSIIFTTALVGLQFDLSMPLFPREGIRQYLNRDTNKKPAILGGFPVIARLSIGQMISSRQGLPVWFSWR
jgi:hypothetical protein